jgi:hypothetical protein
MYSQRLKGQIIDKNSEALIGATLQVINQVSNSEAFAITDQHGKFSIELIQGKYKIISRYLGYKNDERIIEIINSESELIIRLFEDSQLINEIVVISAPPPVIYKKDTTIYFADSFAVGDERKLRELLEKFPGLTIEGNKVTYMGKPITKLMVEDKDFFTGSVGFGINNLPADAVSSVEILQNYSEVPFLKDKIFSDQVALNVKLKKNKRNILFGDLETSLAHTTRSNLGLSAYLYNPKYASNLIINRNTLGHEILSLEDKQYLFSNNTNYVRSMASNENQYSDVFEFNPNFYKSKQNFATIFQNYTISKESDMKLVAVYDDRATSHRSDYFNKFFNSTDPFMESRVNDASNNHRLAYSQFTYTRTKKDNSYLKFKFDYLGKLQRQTDHIGSTIPNFNQSKQNSTVTNRLNGQAEYYKTYNNDVVLSINVEAMQRSKDADLDIKAQNLDFIENNAPIGLDSQVRQAFDLTRNWIKMDGSLALPLRNQSNLALGYTLNQRFVQGQQSIFKSEPNIKLLEDFSILNHLASISYLKNNHNGMLEASIGAQYATYSNMRIINKQLKIVPKFQYKTNLPKIGDMRLEYKRRLGHPEDEELMPIIQIVGVEEVRSGNASSYIIDHHDFALSLSKFSVMKKSRYLMNFRFTLPHTMQSSKVNFDGLYTKKVDTLITGGNQRLNILISYGRLFSGFDISPSIIFSNMISQTLLNNIINSRGTNNLIFRLDIRKFKKDNFRPSLSLQYQKTLSNIGSTSLSNNRFNIKSSVTVKKKDVLFTLNYNPTWILNNNKEGMFFNNSAFEMRHFNKKSPWEFALSGLNLLQKDSNFSVVSNSRTISERVELLFPRQIIFKLGFKF